MRSDILYLEPGPRFEEPVPAYGLPEGVERIVPVSKEGEQPTIHAAARDASGQYPLGLQISVSVVNYKDL